MSQIHPQARTTPRVRAEIQASEDSPAELARRYNISEPTAAKWQARDSVEDRSHRPHKLSTTLSPAQEAIVVELRRLLLLPLDDLLVITREFVNAQASRSALDRCLRRHGVNNLRELQAAASGESAQAAPPKRFKDYEPGFVHVDIKYLPQMPDETARRYLYVGIDRATRWVFVRIYADMETTSAVDFVNRLHEAAPMRIDKLLTDNGACFTDRFQRKSRTPSGKHHFDVRCRALGIEHRLCPPRHPQTNGLVERFNGRIAEITAQTRFHSAAELEQTLMNYVKVYNTRIPQRALDHHTPLDALKSWRAKSPDLFKKRPKNLPGLDKYLPISDLLLGDTLNGCSRKPSETPVGLQILRISAGTGSDDFYVDEADHKWVEVTAAEREKFRLVPNDLLACRFNGNLHYVGSFALYRGTSGVEQVFPDKLIRFRVDVGRALPDYLRFVMNALPARRQIEAFCATTVGNIGISATNLKTVKLRVPSMEEQHRIVAKVTELLALCDQLKAGIVAAQAKQAQLAEALVKQAVATAAG